MLPSKILKSIIDFAELVVMSQFVEEFIACMGILGIMMFTLCIICPILFMGYSLLYSLFGWLTKIGLQDRRR